MTDYADYIVTTTDSFGRRWTGTVRELIHYGHHSRGNAFERSREIAAEMGLIDMDRINSDDDSVHEAEDDRFHDMLPELVATNAKIRAAMTDDPHATCSRPCGDMDSDEIIIALDTYRGDNIWQDIILPLGIDEKATEGLDPHCASGVFALEDGRVFRHAPGQFGGWKQGH